MSSRSEFLRLFMMALGATEVAIDEGKSARLSGEVVFEDEFQDFEWSATEDSVPGTQARNLLKTMIQERLISIDCITVPRDQLKLAYERNIGPISLDQFEAALNDLLSVRVIMIDDGKPSDSFFLHE